MDLRARPLKELLTAGRATESFKQAVLDLARGKRPDAIGLTGANPPAKVGRFLSKLLEERPELEIERLEIQARSGCGNYTGTATVWPGPLTVTFDWDCRWRAEDEELVDAVGWPDQIRAAREFGYQCFRKFEISCE